MIATETGQNTAIKTKGYGASGALIGGKTLKEMDFERQPPKANEVLIDILYCGVCHSDLHQVANDWGNTLYPCVPGHEVIGRIKQVGVDVTKFTVGDVVGVGCMVDSCQHCNPCKEGEEQFCEGPVGWTATYNGYWKPDGSDFNTYGGYSTNIVVNEKFVLRIPDNIDPSVAAPILCAGITTYSPLKHWGVKPGDRVGVIGIGGLGHMAVMLAKAMGATVTAITTKEDKREAALALGASDVLISTDKDAMAEHENTYEFLLCTIPDEFDINPYIPLLKRRGSIVTVGLLAPYAKATNNMEVAKRSLSVGASLIGGIAETQEVLDLCSKHDIRPEVQMIKMQDINDAFDKMQAEDVRFRYVIDMQSLKNEQ